MKTKTRNNTKCLLSVLIKQSQSIPDPIRKNDLPLFRQHWHKLVIKHGTKTNMLQNIVTYCTSISLIYLWKVATVTWTNSLHMKCSPILLPSPTLENFTWMERPLSTACPLVLLAPLIMYAAHVFISAAVATRYGEVTHRTGHIYPRQSEGVRRRKGRSGRPNKTARQMGGVLRDPTNKTALFAFLTCKTEEFIWPADKALYIPSGQAVSLFGSGITMGCCNHQEADAMIVVHLEHVMAQGAKTVWLWTLMALNAASGWCLGCLWQREKVQIWPYQ